VQELEKDFENAINRINQISKTVSQLTQKSALNTPSKSPDLINWKEKTEKMKADLKVQFVELSDFQSLNVKFEKISSQIEGFYKTSNELFSLTNNQLKLQVENLETKVEGLESELKNLKRDEEMQNDIQITSQNEDQKIHSKKNLEVSKDHEIAVTNKPIRNHSQMKGIKDVSKFDSKKKYE